MASHDGETAPAPPARYAMKLREGPDRISVAAFEGIEVQTRRGAIGKLARAMLEAGYPDGTWSANGGHIFGGSLVEVARWTFTKDEVPILWEPMPEHLRGRDRVAAEIQQASPVSLCAR